jgi:hypothetical protein
MPSSRPTSLLHRFAFAGSAALCFALATTSSAQAVFSGTLRYTGTLGPVSGQRPLCLCVYRDPALTVSLGCLISRRNDVNYDLDLGRSDYYLIAFLDIHVNERVDPDEPYEIYRDRGAAPADPAAGDSGRTDIDLIFGDENLPPTPTPTPTRSPPASPTASSTPSPSPTPTCAAGKNPECDGGCIGDCNGDRKVEVNELITIVGAALGSMNVSVCRAGDPDGDGTVQLREVVAAVRRSMIGCPNVSPPLQSLP